MVQITEPKEISQPNPMSVWIGGICLGLGHRLLHEHMSVDVLSDSCGVSPGHYETLLQSNVVRSLHHTLTSARWHLHM